MADRGPNLLTDVQEELSKSYPAVASSIPHVRLAVTQLATRSGIKGEPLEAIRLAVTEAVTNVVKHAYPQRTGAFRLSAAVTGKELRVLVSDDGCGYQNPSQCPGLGWGLTLIAQHSETHVITARTTSGTEIRMRFTIRAQQRTLGSRAARSSSSATGVGVPRLLDQNITEVALDDELGAGDLVPGTDNETPRIGADAGKFAGRRTGPPARESVTAIRGPAIRDRGVTRRQHRGEVAARWRCVIPSRPCARCDPRSLRETRPPDAVDWIAATPLVIPLR